MVGAIMTTLLAFFANLVSDNEMVAKLSIQMAGWGGASVHIGVILFFFSASFLCMSMTAEGMYHGEYRLFFSRSGGAMTIINFEKSPYRFVFQTLAFAALALLMQYQVYRSLKKMTEKRNDASE